MASTVAAEALTLASSTVPPTMANPAYSYHAYLERIANALENLSETTYILAGVFTPVQPVSQLASITGKLTGSLLSELPPAAVALMKPGMILTNLADAPATGAGWLAGLAKITNISSSTSVIISTQYPNSDGPISFMAGGYGLLTCTPPIPIAQADPRPGMLLTGQGILPGTFIVDYVAPGVASSFYVSVPQKGTVALISAAGGFSAMAHSMNTMEADMSSLTNMANNQGIHTVDPYTLVEKSTQYAYFAKNPGELAPLIQSLANLPAELATLKDILKGVTKLP
jgi:hypothetical protein